MRVLIIGGTKFIGKEIARQCLDNSYEVILFNRGKTENLIQASHIKGDVDNIGDFSDELRNLKPDVVVHCIAYTEQHAQDIVNIYKDTNTHLLVLSSQDCYKAFQDLNRGYDESDFPINEDGPLCPIKYYWEDLGISHSGGDKYDKNLMTDVFIAAHKEKKVKPTIFRLPMVYGPIDTQFAHRHGSFIRRIYDRQKKHIISSRNQSALFTFGYVENIGAAIIHAFGKEETIGKIYNIGENKVCSKRRWANLYAKAADWNFEHIVVPEEILSKDKKYQNLPPGIFVADCSQFSIETGFINPVSLDEAIRRTLAWGLNNPHVLGDKPDYKEEERLASAYANFVRKIATKESLPVESTRNTNS